MHSATRVSTLAEAAKYEWRLECNWKQGPSHVETGRQQFSMLDLYSYKQSGLYRMFKNFMVSYTWLHMYPKF